MRSAGDPAALRRNNALSFRNSNLDNKKASVYDPCHRSSCKTGREAQQGNRAQEGR